ncbi:hypothetical protein BH23GEM6_BH23GEM6_21370 [soil metagenome]
MSRPPAGASLAHGSRPSRRTPFLYSAALVGLFILALTACDAGTLEPHVVLDSPREILLSSTALDLADGDTLRIHATLIGQSGQLISVSSTGQVRGGALVKWTSSDPEVVSVDASGLVRARKSGTAVLTATSGPVSSKANAKVGNGKKKAAAVIVSPDEETLTALGASVQLTATVLDDQGGVISDPSLTWSTLNPEVAAVDGLGKVTSKTIGIALIVAMSGSVADTASVEVRQEVATVISPSTTGIWIDATELARLPTSGAPWSNMKSAADTDLRGGALTVRDNHNTRVLAAALVAARLDDTGYKSRVRDALADVIAARFDLEDGLAVLRRLGTYAIAADLIDLKHFDASTDREFREWLEKVRTTTFSGGGGGTVTTYHERRPNNYGTHAGFSRMAVALYLGDQAELDGAALVFRGWLGDRSAYTGFSFGSDLTWHADAKRPLGINPRGATKNGYSIDGVLPDDQRRGGSFSVPAPQENYVYEALQGAIGMAVLLERHGYGDVWNWSDRALLRAFRWLDDVNAYPAEGDDTWQPFLVNRAYGTSFPPPTMTRAGKNLGWTDWTHP